MEPLVYVASAVLTQLKKDVPANMERYTSGDFADLMTSQWSLPTSLSVDADALVTLDGRGAENEVKNSLIVWKALPGFSAAAATEGRIWTRLAHVEALEFSRQRWLTASGAVLKGEKLRGAVRTHFFGESLTKYRDDHAIGRYWWNAFYAFRLATPDLSMERILELLLARADVRLSLLERTEMSSQVPLARAIFERLDKDAGLLADEDRFRTFMKNINVRGGGLLFRAMTKNDVDAVVENCLTPN